MSIKAKPKVFKHAACVIVQRHDGIDVIDPTTGYWRVFPSMRSAKWSATIFSRLAREFGHTTADDNLLEATLNQCTPKG